MGAAVRLERALVVRLVSSFLWMRTVRNWFGPRKPVRAVTQCRDPDALVVGEAGHGLDEGAPIQLRACVPRRGCEEVEVLAPAPRRALRLEVQRHGMVLLPAVEAVERARLVTDAGAVVVLRAERVEGGAELFTEAATVAVSVRTPTGSVKPDVSVRGD